ncbi:serine/threonine-protein phosphatase 7 long form homolog [Amaranthus tricolor]|uniref:serine/threonine-protein phosphatase 7 long form homolog n=1 Tax=Amaranthus tricolor TaxID=29722 RepID=UPI00258B93BD|nr:serine/threonine-protein phosphatase 7 long form homolog [Amaranthus tricolor]
MIFYCKEAFLEAVRVYHIHRNFISKYNGKHGNCVLGSDTVLVGHILLTSSIINHMVKDRFEIEVTYKLAWCAKQQAPWSIYGTWEDSYSLLPRFLKDGDKGIFPSALASRDAHLSSAFEVRPPNDAVRGSDLKCTCLARTFLDLPEGADEGTIERYAKAYLLYLIGTVLFTNKTSSQVQILYLTLLDAPWKRIAGYSWGSGALAYLYRRLCAASRKNLWAYEHILSVVAPPPTPDQDFPYGSRWSFARRTRTHIGSSVGFYWDQLDHLRADQFCWNPYPVETYVALPQHSGIQTWVWRAFVPRICFNIVEVHLLECVMLQFGMVLGIPPPCDTKVELHLTSRKGQSPKD